MGCMARGRDGFYAARWLVPAAGLSLAAALLALAARTPSDPPARATPGVTTSEEIRLVGMSVEAGGIRLKALAPAPQTRRLDLFCARGEITAP